MLSHPVVFSQLSSLFDLLPVVSDSCTDTDATPPTVPYSTPATLQLLPVMMMISELNPPNGWPEGLEFRVLDPKISGTLGRRGLNY